MHRSLHARDRGCIARDSEPDDLEVARSDGGLVIDARGRRYIDFSVGWNVGNLGWTRPEIRQRMSRFDGPTYVEPDFLYRPWVELAELLAGMAPGPKLTHGFRLATGTEAVEVADCFSGLITSSKIMRVAGKEAIKMTASKGAGGERTALVLGLLLGATALACAQDNDGMKAH